MPEPTTATEGIVFGYLAAGGLHGEKGRRVSISNSMRTEAMGTGDLARAPRIVEAYDYVFIRSARTTCLENPQNSKYYVICI